MKELLFSRRGDAFAWFASLLVLVFLPLASLSIDVTRLMYVRGHLQTAVDAACQSAADALDTRLFISTGQVRIEPGLARSQAAREFHASLEDTSRVRYSADSLTISFPAPTLAHCSAAAEVQRMMPLTPLMRVRIETTSEMRAMTMNAAR